ncbi:MAG: ATP-binding protein [Planctomycetaceae bacterium]|nr:ATP-binding protein [Planctomycetaceae bacterium]
MTGEPQQSLAADHSPRPSLRRRILFWQTTLLAVVVLSFGLAIYLQQRQTRLQDIDSELAAAAKVLRVQLQALADRSAADSEDVARGLMPQRVAAETWRVPDTFARRHVRHRYEQPYLVIRDAQQQILVSTATTDVPAVDDVSGRGPFQRTTRGRGDYREAWETGPSDTLILVGRHVAADFRDLRELAFVLTAIGVVVLCLGFAAAWRLSASAVSPIAGISEVAVRLSETRLDERIDASRMDVEFEQLAHTLNAAVGRLEVAFAQQVKFTADASHELRTPLAVIRMHQDLALSKDRSAADYRQTIETCARATARMSRLVEGLLELARLDGPRWSLQTTSTDLEFLIREVVDDCGVLAAASGVRLQMTLTPIVLELDAGRFTQVIWNLLSNAITHSPEGGTVFVELEPVPEEAAGAEACGARLTVCDEGPGIAAEYQSRVFDRFFRVEQERSRQTGGSGLGLAICRAIVQAHQGRIGIRSEPGEGTCVEVCLPTGAERARSSGQSVPPGSPTDKSGQ